jgi:hypothetical protein
MGRGFAIVVLLLAAGLVYLLMFSGVSLSSVVRHGAAERARAVESVEATR